MPLTLIALTGSMNSGKTTISNYLTHTYGFTEYAFANPIKDIGLTLGFEKHQMYGTQKQKLEINQYLNISGREFLQKFGTEIGRNLLPQIIPSMQLGESIWIRLFEIYMEKIIKEYPNGCIVVSDVRFLNEADVIKKYGGYIIKIERPSDVFTTELYKHSSETEMTKINPDFTIDNIGTIENLHNKITFITDYIIHNV